MTDKTEFLVSTLIKKATEDFTEKVNYAKTHGSLFDKVLSELPVALLVRTDTTGYSFDISVQGDKHAVATCFRVLRNNGFQTDKKPKEKETNFSAFFKHQGTGTQIWLIFTSTSCRRVKVGTTTRMVEEDVYDVVCDEITYPKHTEGHSTTDISTL